MGAQPERSSRPATSSSPARHSRDASARTRAARSSFVASKNSLVAGPNAAAYSTAKAAELHLARCLAEEGGAARHPRQHRQPGRGPAGFADLGLELADERADAYGIAPEDLDEYYRKRTSLGVNVLPEDIAQAVMHFASAARSGKSTGNLLNVDGGVAAAFPR